MEIKKIGVVGSGAMGTGIAHVSAQSGYEVVVYDIAEAAIGRSRDNIAALFDKSIQKGKATEELKAETLGRMTFTTDINAMKDTDLVIEAVVENLDLKMKVFAQLDSIVKPDTILASNTSTMSITKLATSVKRPEAFAGVHFFNPAQVMRLVELIRGYYTSDETIKSLQEYVRAIGKESIEVKKDVPGFVVNRLMLIQFKEAQLVYEEGIASLEDIDKAMTLGLNHPMGPFTLMDFTGLDISYDSLVYLYNEFGQDKWAPPVSLKRMINAGRLGKKTGGKGWFDTSKK
jgi:3-hydroxybutyryl-CoA dehydrogenase